MTQTHHPLLPQHFFLGRLFAMLAWNVEQAVLCPPRRARFRIVERLFRILEQEACDAGTAAQGDKRQGLIAEVFRRWKEHYLNDEHLNVIAEHYETLNRLANEGRNFIKHHCDKAREILKPARGLMQALEHSVMAGVADEARVAFSLGRRLGEGLRPHSVYRSLHRPGADDPFVEGQTTPATEPRTLVVACERRPGELGLSVDWLNKVQRIWHDLDLGGDLPKTVPTGLTTEGCWQFVRKLVRIAGDRLTAMEQEHSASGDETPEPPAIGQGRRYFVKKQDIWVVCFDGSPGQFKDIDGMAYIAYLLEKPHRLMSAIKLYQLVHGVPAGRSITHQDPGQDEDPQIAQLDAPMDEQGLKEIKASMMRLANELKQARENNDTLLEKELQEEFDKYAAYLKQQHDTAGRQRPIVKGDPNEKARSTVRKAMGRAYDNIREKRGFAKLADYLEKHIIPDGPSFAFRPDPDDPAWTVSITS